MQTLQTIILLLAGSICAAQSCDSPITLGEQGVDTLCFDAPLMVSDEWTAECPSWLTASAYWFTITIVDDLPYTIMVESTVDYTFDAGDPIPYFIMLITDDCEGSTLLRTSDFDDCTDSTPYSTNWPGEVVNGVRSFWLDLMLPPGQYWVYCGTLGVVPYDMEGCFTITGFNQSLLGLSVYELERYRSGRGRIVFDTSGRLINLQSNQ